MHGEFLLHTGAILGALALAALLFQRARQSIVPAFILVGILVRPLVGESRAIELLAMFGVVLLLFFMGLEFSLGALLRDRREIVRTGLADLIACFPVGLAAGLALGGGWSGALLLAGGFYVSSSAIVSKSVIELRRAADPETTVALGILVFEDLFIALFLALLSGAVLTERPEIEGVIGGVLKAFVFFGVVIFIALRARRLIGRALEVDSDDVFILLIGSVVVLLSWGAIAAGLSEAIGAFLAGLAMADTGHRERIERLFAPLQGLFAAIFFLGFGLSIDPGAFVDVWPQVLALAVAAVAVKLAAGWWAGRGSGLSRRGALSLGMLLIPRGEFTIVLAGIAIAAGEARIASVLALFVLVMSLVGTVAIQVAPAVAARLFPPPRVADLKAMGFSPELAGTAEEGADAAMVHRRNARADD